MSTIKGIFEPFYEYVTTQLNIRKAIIGQGASRIEEGTGVDSTTSINPSSDNAEFNKKHYTHGNIAQEIQNLSEVLIPTRRDRGAQFFAYTTQKQCTIRMASGVDVRKENNLLDEYENHLTGEGLARNWVLEGGVKGMMGQRSGFNGEAYGDPSIRSEASEGFGIVPMPGITDATIDTKSDNGSLREAKVNFVCYNRRQLEVLEALYMRPGYPILLEWGWVPYISNPVGEDYPKLENDTISILDEFMDAEENLNSLNKKISEYKEQASGNYDGFIGFCKNFSFKVREDGGYDCVTEIIAHGEILESLKTPIALAPKLLTASSFKNIKDIETGRIPREYESIDKFLFYLRAIKSNLDTAGDKATLEYLQTTSEIYKNIEVADHPTPQHIAEYINTEVNYGTVESPQYIMSSQSQKAADDLAQLVKESYVTKGGGPAETFDKSTLVGSVTITKTYAKFYGFKDADGKVIKINLLNEIHPQYAYGFEEIKEIVKDIAKVSEEELKRQKEAWVNQLINSKLEARMARSGAPKGKMFDWNWFIGKKKENDFLKHIKEARLKMRTLATAGLDPILEGTILKEISVEDEDENDSGIRKKIFVRWDLICQILNKKVTPEYKKNHALVELTYLNPNQPTFKEGSNTDSTSSTHKKWPGGGYYLEYSANKTVFSRKGEEKENPLADKVKKSEFIIGNPKVQKEVEEYAQDQKVSEIKFDSLGQSFDHNVCLMPHQIHNMRNKSWKPSHSDQNWTINTLTSFYDTSATDYSIGMVYFNLDYLIQTYEELALETFKTDVKGVEKTKRRLKNKFSFHDFITTIWEGVNDACGGYYSFGLHTEHSRPHVVRVIDFTFNGGTKDIENNRNIFQFDPQGLGSISRESSYVSKIDNDFASTISIAAQSPINIHSLEAMSFKSFHKNIKNRFTTLQDEQKSIDDFHINMERQYKADVQQFNNALLSLDFYILRMNNSNYETESVQQLTSFTKVHKKPMSPSVAKEMASRLEEMQHSIDSRHGEKEGNIINNTSKTKKVKGKYPDAPWVGTYRDKTTFNRSAIIPITVNMTIDGIGGITPLQIFKINPLKLPKGYQNKDIVFVVKKETNKITSGQDWTTDLTGYLTLLNDNQNLGENTDNYLISDIDNTKKNLDDEDEREEILQDPLKEITVTSAWAKIRPSLSPYRHPGIDLRASTGTEIYSPADGKVLKADNTNTNPTCGNSIEIKHTPSGIRTKYCHLSKICVKDKATVKQGQVIGLTGGNEGDIGAGHSKVEHLHYEVYDQGTDYAQNNRYTDNWKKGHTGTSNPDRYLEITEGKFNNPDFKALSGGCMEELGVFGISDFDPNPTSGITSFTFNGTNGRLEIVNMLGTKYKDIQLEQSGKRNLDISGLSDGAYLVQLIDGDNQVITVKQLIKKTESGI